MAGVLDYGMDYGMGRKSPRDSSKDYYAKLMTEGRQLTPEEEAFMAQYEAQNNMASPMPSGGGMGSMPSSPMPTNSYEENPGAFLGRMAARSQPRMEEGRSPQSTGALDQFLEQGPSGTSSKKKKYENVYVAPPGSAGFSSGVTRRALEKDPNNMDLQLALQKIKESETMKLLKNFERNAIGQPKAIVPQSQGGIADMTMQQINAYNKKKYGSY